MQTPFEAVTRKLAQVEFAENPEPRVPCVLLLDTSGSMSGTPIAELNAGLREFYQAIIADDLARKRAEIAIVTFGGAVRTLQPFATVDSINSSELTAGGGTPMCEALRLSAELIDQRKSVLRANGIALYRPWVFLLTDGAPTDMERWQETLSQVRQAQVEKRFTLFPVGVGESADFNLLGQLISGERVPLKLRGLDFRRFFLWLSCSLQSVSRSQVGQSVALPNPVSGQFGWGTVAT